MSYLRLIHDNAADRATIVASSTTGALGVQYLKTDRKGEVHRSVGTSVAYDLTWLTPQTIGGVALPAVNLTNMGEIRATAFNGADLLGDTGWTWAAPGLDTSDWDWEGELNGNAFPPGFLAKTAVWFREQLPVTRLVIELRDTYIQAGYIDCARIVAGRYWQPTFNAEKGAQNNVVESFVTARSDAGDEVVDRGTQHDTMQLNLSVLLPQERAFMQRLMRTNGSARRIFISAVEGSGDTQLKQDWLIYGRPQIAPISFGDVHSTQMTIEGW